MLMPSLYLSVSVDGGTVTVAVDVKQVIAGDDRCSSDVLIKEVTLECVQSKCINFDQRNNLNM